MHKIEAFRPLRAIQSAWDILMKAPLPMWIGGLILVVVESLGGMGGGGGNTSVKGPGDADAFIRMMLPMAMLGFATTLLILAATAWLKTGYYLGVEKVMRQGDVEFEELFKTRGRWLNVFLTLLLQAFACFFIAVPGLLCALVAVAVGSALHAEDAVTGGLVLMSILAYTPVAIYLFLGLMLMAYPAALDGRGPIESLSDSWRIASGVRIQLFLMMLLYFALIILGLMACCVGVIPAGIISEVMFCEAYVQATRDGTDDWWIRARNGPVPDGGWEGPTGVPKGPASAEEGAGTGVAQAAPPPEPQPEPQPEPPAETASAPAPPAGEAEGEPGAFDPSAWRKGDDIPPIEEDPEA